MLKIVKFYRANHNYLDSISLTTVMKKQTTPQSVPAEHHRARADNHWCFFYLRCSCICWILWGTLADACSGIFEITSRKFLKKANSFYLHVIKSSERICGFKAKRSGLVCGIFASFSISCGLIFNFLPSLLCLPDLVCTNPYSQYFFHLSYHFPVVREYS